jgi:signal recognition particle subunit SEC65
MDAIIYKYGFKEGLTTKEGKIISWPYSEKKPTQAELATLIEKHKADTEYIEKRKEAYPPVEDQLDTIFHKGLGVWEDNIAEIKAKYPKPS